MADQHIEAWDGLVRAAEAALRGETGVRVRGHRVLQLLVRMPFDPWVAWELYQIGGGRTPEGYHLVRRVWRRDVDLDKVRTPVEWLRHRHDLAPTIEVREVAALTPEAADAALLGRLSRLAVPLDTGRETKMYIDGVGFEMEWAPGHYGSLRLEWHGSSPPAWSELRAAFHQTLEAAEAIAASAASGA